MSPGPAKQFDRDEVLHRAMEHFWEHGYSATGMSQLLSHVGIGRQSLYDTFGSKEELFLEALDAYQQGRQQMMLDLIEAPQPPLENLKSVFALWEELTEEEACRGCLLANSSAELAENPRVRQRLQRSFRTMEEAFEQMLRRARDAGDLEPETNTTGLAKLLITTAQGLALMARAQGDRAFTRQVVDTLFSLLPLTASARASHS